MKRAPVPYKLILALGLAILACIVILQNTSPVQVRFLAWSIELSQVVLMIGMLLIGFVLGWGFCGYLRFRKQR